MKPNWIVALLMGLVLGYAIGHAVKETGGAPTLPGRAMQPAGPAPTDEASLAIKSADMPAGTFTGMADPQKLAVMRVMNEVECECGCGRGSLATCIKTDPGCPNSPAKLKQLVGMARDGKSYEQMKAELGGKPARPPARPADDMTTVFKVPVDDSPTLGRSSAPITLVEISDYQCPFCSRGNTTILQLQKEYGDKLRLVMKQNPLDSIHPQARGAAKAALAAGAQGKYWQMHDKMFENQRALDQGSLEKYAQEVGLDVARFKKDQADPKWDQVIAKDQALASQLQATSTPQFFINGRRISGARDISIFKQVIDEELTKVEALVKSGVKPEQVYATLMDRAASAPSAAPPPAAAAPAAAAVKKVPVPDDAPYLGPKHAKVTIVEFSDFECPFCQRAIPALNQLKDAYPKDVKVVFRQYPLPPNMHPNAQISAEASLAAHEQGKFWPMHDKMFENRTALNRESLEKYAEQIGLNMSKFRSALDSGKFKQKVSEDMAAGSSVGVNGTPTFFINGQMQVGGLGFDQWKARIDEEIKKADKLLATGVKPEKLYEKLLEEGSNTAPAVAAAPTPPAPGVAPPAGPVKDVPVGNAPVKGPKGAPVTIVEYSDFQCPFCSQGAQVLKQLESTYKDKLRIAYKHQPLQSMHPNAQMAAEASMAAQEQGRFWEYHDKLFANQRALDRASLEKYAQEIGLDMNRFKSALDSGKFKGAVANDSGEGNRIGADATPTFFVNGRMVQGADLNQIKALIDDELAKKKK